MSYWRFLVCGLLLFAALPAQAQVPFSQQPRPNGPYEIRGVVMDARTGQPLPEVELSFQESAQPNGPPFEIIESDANGAFYVKNLAEGKYTIRATRQGYAEQAFLQHENYWTGIAVGPGKDSLHVRFPLAPSATITGQVTDENGEAVREAPVTLWIQQMENGARGITQGQIVQTDDEGRYRLEHLLIGEYSVSVSAVPWYSRYALAKDEHPFPPGWEANYTLPDVVYPTLYYPNTRDWHEMGWVKLQAGQTETVDFRLAPEPSAHLQVRMGEIDTRQPPNVALMMELPGGGRSNMTFRSVRRDSGILEISGIPSGRYQVQTGGAGGEERDAEQTVDLSVDSQLRLDGPAAGGTTIRGVIHVAAGTPRMEQVLLQLKDAEGRVYNSVFYDSSGSGNANNQPGTFEFANVPAVPQSFQLSILQPQDAVVKRIEAKAAKVTGTTIETDGSQEVSLTVFVEQISNSLEGTAMKQGKPFAGAMILLMPADGKDWERLARRDQTDSDGTFRLATILPGKYLLFALENGWEIEWSKPEVLKPFLPKVRKLEVEEGPLSNVTLEVQ